MWNCTVGIHTVLECRCPFPVNLHVQSGKGFTSSWKDTSMACRCAWCGQLKRMDRKLSGLLPLNMRKMSRWCLPSSLSAWLQQFNKTSRIGAVSQMRNRYRMLWIIHLSPKPSLKMDENGGSLPWYQLSTYPTVSRPGRLTMDGIAHIKAFTVSFKGVGRHLTTPGPWVNWDGFALVNVCCFTPRVCWSHRNSWW